MSQPTRESPSTVLARQIVTSLVESGVEWVAYCPGSRDAPLAYALWAAEGAGWLSVATFADERGAGFWAVGAAKALGSPVAIVTTSGTAVAELHPALQEAHHQGLPIIAITADRPFELRGVGASQTTFQEGIFGSAVVAQDSFPAENQYSAELLRQIGDRIRRLLAVLGGPVHLNVAFRDPLVPNEMWEPGDRPVQESFLIGSSAHHPEWDEVVDPRLRTVVVAGDRAEPGVIDAAERRSIPILGEPSSGATRTSTWISHSAWITSSLSADIQQVIVTGHPTLSRAQIDLLGRQDLRKIVVSARQPWPDISGSATLVVKGIRDDEPIVPPQLGWIKRWQDAARVAEVAIVKEVDASLNLLSVARLIWETSPSPSLWLGASNTIRGFDLGASGPGPVGVHSNRGLAGIDGTVASALGFAIASRQPVRAVMGDLTFAYDLATLASRPEKTDLPDLQVIVLDDGGGSIFATLEHGSPHLSQVYERYFAVPQAIDPVQVAVGCGWVAIPVTSLEQLRNELAKPISGRSLLSIRIPRPASQLKYLRQQIAAELIG